MADKREPMLSLLFGDYFVNPEDVNEKQLFSSIATEAKLLQNGSTSEVISHINICLNSSHKRKEGASLLETVLRQSNSEVFQQHAETWAKLLLHAVLKTNDFEVQQVTCRAMSQLLRSSVAFPELSRSFAVNIVPQLLSYVLAFPEKWINLTLTTLINCMRYFPGPCGTVRLKMEQVVLQWLTRSELACKAYSYLPQCGGAGNAACKYTAAWSSYFNKLVASVTDSLDDLYGLVETEVARPNTSAVSLVFPELPETEPARIMQLVKRIESLCHAMTRMLRPTFPAPVQLELNHVLQVVCRMVAISPDFLLTRPTVERVRLAEFIPIIHTVALSVLDGLTKFAGSSMIPVAHTVNQIYTQSLVCIRKMQPAPRYGTPVAYAGVEQAVWKSIIVWLETLDTSCGVEDIAEDLIKAAVQITTPVQDSVASEQNNNKLHEVSDMFHGKRGKGKKRSRAMQDTGQLSSQRKLDYTADWQLVATVWQAVSAIIRKVGAYIKPSCFQAVHHVLFVVLSPKQPPIPYVQPKCLSSAYDALMACVTCPHPAWPAPVQVAATLFSCHQQNPMVRKQCSLGLEVCGNIIHPRAPSIQLPLDLEDLAIENKKSKEIIEQPPRNLYVLPSNVSKIDPDVSRHQESSKEGTSEADINLEQSVESDPDDVYNTSDEDSEENEEGSPEAMVTDEAIDTEIPSTSDAKPAVKRKSEDQDNEGAEDKAPKIARHEELCTEEEAKGDHVTETIAKPLQDTPVEEHTDEMPDTNGEVDLMMAAFNPDAEAD